MEADLLQKVDLLIRKLQQDPLYESLSDSHRTLLDDPEVTALTERFNRLCRKRASMPGITHDPAFMKTLHEAKLALDSHPAIRRHKTLEQAFEAMLDELGRRLAGAVSKRIPHGRSPFITGGFTCKKEKA